MIISKNWIRTISSKGQEKYHQRSRAKILKVKNEITNEIIQRSRTKVPEGQTKSSRTISRTKIPKNQTQKFKNDIKNEDTQRSKVQERYQERKTQG